MTEPLYVPTPADLAAPEAPAQPPAPTDTPEAVEAATEPTEADDESATFPAEYVRKLRAEAAEHRVKAKIADVANEHLLAAYAQADGRLVDVEVLALSDDLLGDDGLVDPAKVSAAIAGLVEAKPYLRRRTPTSPIPQGVREPAAETPGLFAIARERLR
jgi:hypothetical protein